MHNIRHQDNNGKGLEFVAEELQKDNHLLLAAVQQFSLSLHWLCIDAGESLLSRCSYYEASQLLHWGASRNGGDGACSRKATTALPYGALATPVPRL